MILTEFKEIFCGWTDNTEGERVKLRAAKQACYFSADSHGLLGLAINGPGKGSRISPAADIECRRVVNVIECSLGAIAVWEKAGWQK